MTTRAELLTLLDAKMSDLSMSNPSQSAMNDLFRELAAAHTAPAQRAVTATADGTGTGQLTADDEYVTVTSADANNIVTLPAIADVSDGKEITLEATATGFEVRTPAASGTTINNVDSDGTNEVAIAATGLAVFTATSAGWLLQYFTEAGVASAPIPDLA